MAPVKWQFSGHVDAPPDAVFAWMSDYREDDHTSEAFHRGAKTTEKDRRGGASRKVTSRQGNVLEVEDAWGHNRFAAKVTLDPAARELRIEGGFGYSSLWRAVPDGPGTRVETQGRIAPTGAAKVFTVFMGKGFQRQMESDFNGHMEEMRVDLAGPHSPTA